MEIVNIEILEQCEGVNNNNNTSFGVQMGGGAILTWKDLYVMAADKSRRSTILEGLTGYAVPGEVLAIMGPSGSGKSTLLDALAGRLLSNMKQSGEILVNGRKEGLSFGTAAYVTQDDILMTTLTIREAVYYSALLQLPDTMSKSEKLNRVDNAIKMMGLQNAMDTIIGGRTTAGISSGQRRRVCICMEILTRPRLLFLDEATSGLDSAASYHVMSYIIKLAREEQTTVLASIHQPSSEVFELFQYLCLLSYGKTVYFGHSSAANTFFEKNGYPCPGMRNPSDHYLRIINNDFESGESVENSTEKTVSSLANSYKSSKEYLKVQTQLSEMSQKEGVELERRRKSDFVPQCLVLIKRSSVNMYRDPGYYRVRFVMYIAVSSCIGSIFYNLGHSYETIQARASLFAFTSGFLTFMSIGGFPSFSEDMKIFRRERLNGHYGVSAYVISNTLSSIPFLILISIIPGALMYYLSGLQKEFYRFFYFLLMFISGMLTVESLMMVVACIIPDFLMGITVGAGIQGIVFLTSGFFRLPNHLTKPIWKYPLYYILYGTYNYEGLLKNEFQGMSFTDQAGVKNMLNGEQILEHVFEIQVNYSKWVNIAILLAMVVCYRLVFFWVIKIGEIRRNK